MELLYVINSIIHKPGNIGKRIGKIIDSKERKDVNITLMSRGGRVVEASSQVNMSFFGQIARILNAVRIYISHDFKSRVYDIKLFEIFFFLNLKYAKNKSADTKIAHVLEYSPKIITKLKGLGYKVILDVPIGPSHYVDRLLKENGSTFGMTLMPFMQPYEEGAFREADLITVPSDFVKDELIKVGVDESKIVIIPFGVDVNVVERVYEIKPNVDFCFAGVISSRKGLNFLLEAWDCPELSNCRLHLLGRLTPEIKKEISRLNLDNIILPGFVDVQKYFLRCDVYVFPSLLEGSSKSIYEAMSSGLPVITTLESGSIVKDNDTGFIVEKCDFSAIRAKMIYYKENPNEISLMGRRAKLLVSEFTWDKYSDDYFELYFRESSK